MFDKVFISYASEDFKFASELYDFLEFNGFTPWLDKRKILPGQNWNFVIQQALRESHYIIILLSNVSVQKRGYVQREFKLALQYLEEKLESDIYIIPLNIDGCKIPSNLSTLHWVEYSNNEGFNLVLQALSLQRSAYREAELKQIAAKEHFSYKEYEDNYEYENHIKFSIQSQYFQFDDSSNINLKELNSIISAKNIESILAQRKLFFNYVPFDKAYKGLDWSYSISSSLNFISNSVISISLGDHGFYGGAHGNGVLIGLNYYLNPLIEIQIQDLFIEEDHGKALKFISNYCFEELRKVVNKWQELTEEELAMQTPENLFWEDSLTPKWENFNVFLISKIGLEIIFNTYSVTGYVYGLNTVLIPYEKIQPQLSNPQLLNNLVSKIQGN